MKLDSSFFIDFFKTVVLASLVSLFSMKFILDKEVNLSSFLPLLALIIVLLFVSTILVKKRKEAMKK